MPTLAAGQQIWLPQQLDTDNSPPIGVILAIATNANIVAFDTSPGADVGDSAPPTNVTLSDNALALYLDVTAYTAIPPGSIVRIGQPGLAGNPDLDFYAFVVKSFEVTQDGEGASYFTGGSVGAQTTLPLIYVEVLTECRGAAANLGLRQGQRMLIPLFTGQTAVVVANAGLGARLYTL